MKDERILPYVMGKQLTESDLATIAGGTVTATLQGSYTPSGGSDATADAVMDMA